MSAPQPVSRVGSPTPPAPKDGSEARKVVSTILGVIMILVALYIGVKIDSRPSWLVVALASLGAVAVFPDVMFARAVSAAKQFWPGPR